MSGKKLYNMAACQDYLLPGGYPKTTTSIVDMNNNVYPVLGYYYYLEIEEEQLEEYNKANRQGVLFL